MKWFKKTSANGNEYYSKKLGDKWARYGLTKTNNLYLCYGDEFIKLPSVWLKEEKKYKQLIEYESLDDSSLQKRMDDILKDFTE